HLQRGGCTVHQATARHWGYERWVTAPVRFEIAEMLSACVLAKTIASTKIHMRR
ncbi:hypothetical protein L9F63_001998, partial [Diploptera punctata]